jgi:hypothetical protein
MKSGHTIFAKLMDFLSPYYTQRLKQLRTIYLE